MRFARTEIFDCYPCSLDTVSWCTGGAPNPANNPIIVQISTLLSDLTDYLIPDLHLTTGYCSPLSRGRPPVTYAASQNLVSQLGTLKAGNQCINLTETCLAGTPRSVVVPAVQKINASNPCDQIRGGGGGEWERQKFRIIRITLRKDMSRFMTKPTK